jgi:hypothetical protein
MKTTNMLLALAGLCAAATTQATVLTVDNTPSNNAQYSTFSAALTAAVAGDTILLQPSAASYGTLNISKSIVLLGAGHNTQGNAGTLTDRITISANNVTIKGARVNGASSGSPAIRINNNISGAVVMNNYIFAQNGSIVIDGGGDHIIVGNVMIGFISVASNVSGVLILNNYIQNVPASVFGAGFSISITLGSINAVLKNNVFYHSGANPFFSTTAVNSIFSDNIFIAENPATFAANPCAVCLFSFNLTWSPNGAMLELLNSTLNNVAPTWTDATLGFDYNDDYHMMSGLPLTGASDGGQVGLHGGLYPNFFRYDGRVVGLPFVTSLFITTPVVTANGQIQVEFEAEAISE